MPLEWVLAIHLAGCEIRDESGVYIECDECELRVLE